MAIDQPRLDDARKALVEEVQTLVGEVVFNKTYFSLEKRGLGDGVIRRPDGLSTEEYGRLNAFLRVFTDAYRVQGVGGTLSPGRGHRFAISRSGALSGGWPSASGHHPKSTVSSQAF